MLELAPVFRTTPTNSAALCRHAFWNGEYSISLAPMDNSCDSSVWIREVPFYLHAYDISSNILGFDPLSTFFRDWQTPNPTPEETVIAFKNCFDVDTSCKGGTAIVELPYPKDKHGREVVHGALKDAQRESQLKRTSN